MDFLDKWRTNSGLTIFGIIVGIIISRIVFGDALLDSLPLELLLIFGIAAIAYSIIGIVYAAVIYPSLFTARPKAKSPGSVSFLNGLFGSFIFGVIWNINLTNRKKGISHIVYVILAIVLNVVMFFIYY